MLKKNILCLGISLCMLGTEIKSSYAYLDARDTNFTLFHQLAIVIALLDQYEHEKYTGLKVNFGKDGKYYSRFLGENWWEYFFKKIDVGDTQHDELRIKKFEKNALCCTPFHLDADRAHQLIQKYIIVQPQILQKVSTFQDEHLNDAFVVGVEYIKNDAATYGVPKVPYKQIYDLLLIHLLAKPNLKIFVHTNDPRFYAFLKIKHPDNVIKYQEKTTFELPADEAEYELINCLLLAKTDLLLCTPSYFSVTLKQFNPSLPTIEFGELTATKTE